MADATEERETEVGNLCSSVIAVTLKPRGRSDNMAVPFMFCDPVATVTKYVEAAPTAYLSNPTKGILRLSTGTVISYYRFGQNPDILHIDSAQAVQDVFFDKFRVSDHIQVCFGPPLRKTQDPSRDAIVGDVESGFSFYAGAIPSSQ